MIPKADGPLEDESSADPVQRLPQYCSIFFNYQDVLSNEAVGRSFHSSALTTRVEQKISLGAGDGIGQ